MRINNLIARFLVNKTTKEEWDTLESWKQESQDNLNELLEMQSIWKDSVDLRGYKQYDKKSAWDLIDGQLDSDETLETKPKTLILSLKWAAGTAAAIAIAIVSIFSMTTDIPDGYNHVATNSIIEEFTLPDGSGIHINRNSALDYAQNFTENRNVILDGEAYFDVARDEANTFTIKTDEADITVLGTSFNIVENKNSVDVFVTSGKVKVSVGKNEVFLTKNQMVRCSDGKIQTLDYPGRNYLSWKTNRLSFEETPLHKVVQDLSRHYKVKLVFAGDSKAMNQTVTDTFENEDFESVLETLVLITGIKYIKEDKAYIIQ